jgi:VanZ family protein
MGMIFYFSAQPAGGHHAWWVIVVRKLGHVSGYALLTALWAWALQGFVRRPVLWAVGISLVYACTDEFHQTFVRGREGTPRDIAIDAVGMAIAAWILTRRSSPPGRREIDANEARVPRSSLAR